jgi:hypothetical protein
MPHRGKRDLHIDPPTSSNAIMQRARAPTAERTVNPAGASRKSLTFNPRVREQPRLKADIQSPEIEVRYTPSNRHSLAGTPCLPEIISERAQPCYPSSISPGRSFLSVFLARGRISGSGQGCSMLFTGSEFERPQEPFPAGHVWNHISGCWALANISVCYFWDNF